MSADGFVETETNRQTFLSAWRSLFPSIWFCKSSWEICNVQL